MGGVWKVNAAYTVYTLRNFNIKQGYIVDTNFNNEVEKVLGKYNNLKTICGNFDNDEIIAQISQVDVIYLFDVLLHQVDPDWDEILEKYTPNSKCFVIYNQQYINADHSIRLTELPLKKYREIAPRRKDDLYNFVYAHKNEIHPEHKKPWKDIHNVWQWGITDNDLRQKMSSLGFKEVYYKNYGQFSNLKSFEDHAFIFLKK